MMNCIGNHNVICRNNYFFNSKDKVRCVYVSLVGTCFDVVEIARF